MTDPSRSDRILVGVDGSASSVDALRHAARIAAALDAPLEVMTAWNYPAWAGYAPTADWSPAEDAEAVLSAAVHEAFDGAPPPDLTTKVVQGAAARTLIEQSRDSGMLVLGSRGHGGFVGMLLGSVSAACAEHAHCPVLIVHSEDSPSDSPSR
jgi:nucleotide-binding universal stress UspA family protein